MLSKERLALSTDAQAMALLDRLGKQLENYAIEYRELETDRDRGWDLARWWNDRTHQVRHTYRNALHMANARLERVGEPLVAEPDVDVPNDLEAPIPRK